MKWRKSSYSSNGNCVEVALLSSGQVAIRDSKNPTGPILELNANDWQAFLTWMRTDAIA